MQSKGTSSFDAVFKVIFLEVLQCSLITLVNLCCSWKRLHWSYANQSLCTEQELSPVTLVMWYSSMGSSLLRTFSPTSCSLVWMFSTTTSRVSPDRIWLTTKLCAHTHTTSCHIYTTSCHRTASHTQLYVRIVFLCMQHFMSLYNVAHTPLYIIKQRHTYATSCQYTVLHM